MASFVIYVHLDTRKVSKQTASLDFAKQVLDGDFDAEAVMEADYVANRICDIMKKIAKRTQLGKG